MENMSSEPSQGGGLGRAFLGPVGIWSLEDGTGQGQAESFIGMSPGSHSFICRASAVFSLQRPEH